MERKPLSTGSIVGAVVLLVVVLLGLYVGGYFALGKYDTNPNAFSREYRYDWLAYAYRPMARVESMVTGKVVSLWGSSKFYLPSGEGMDIPFPQRPVKRP